MKSINNLLAGEGKCLWCLSSRESLRHEAPLQGCSFFYACILSQIKPETKTSTKIICANSSEPKWISILSFVLFHIGSYGSKMVKPFDLRPDKKESYEPLTLNPSRIFPNLPAEPCVPYPTTSSPLFSLELSTQLKSDLNINITALLFLQCK